MTYGTRPLLDFQECGVFAVSGFQLFFIGKITNLGSWGSSEYLRLVGLAPHHSKSGRMRYLTSHSRTLLFFEVLGAFECQTIHSLAAAQQHSTTQHPTLTASKTGR